MTKSKHGRKQGGLTGILVKIFLLIFLVSAGILGYLLSTYYTGQKVYDDLHSYTDIEAKQLGDVTIDWDSLRAINPDIVGWVYVPDTVISYPVVWKADDNSYYLTHNFNNQSTQFGAEYGCIFLSGNNKSDWTNNSNFVFGHNMWNGQIFSVFSDNQGNSDWFNSHRQIYIFTPEGNYSLTTYAQIKVSGMADDIVYTSFGSAKDMGEYVDQVKAQSIVTPSPAAKATSEMSRLFTFSTCSSPDDDMRIITYADVSEFYSFTDSTQNINITVGTKGSYVSQQSFDSISSDTAARTQ